MTDTFEPPGQYAKAAIELIEKNPSGSQVFALLAIASAIDDLAVAVREHTDVLRQGDGD